MSSRSKTVANSGHALERLRILLGTVPTGGELRLPPERELAEEIGVGRRALRRALEVLEDEGLIWRRQGKGTFGGSEQVSSTLRVNNLAEFTNPLEVIEVRITIEPVLARLAATKATPALIQQLERLAAKAKESTDTDSWELWDGAFHRKIAEAAGNQLFILFIGMIEQIRQNDAWRHFRERTRSVGRTTLSIQQHNDVIEAIRRFHPAEAEAAMREHLISLRTALIEAMQSADIPRAGKATSAKEQDSKKKSFTTEGMK
ncbi:MAG: FadR/GntR family transcriptional regulator [Phyllobacterium sp.]|uniref:FadR/GntR family transcriptional regulator n=1 Tax=Phyllobacterium sp. TaxID=1871046 RepID=UPI0030F1097B